MQLLLSTSDVVIYISQYIIISIYIDVCAFVQSNRLLTTWWLLQRIENPFCPQNKHTWIWTTYRGHEAGTGEMFVLLMMNYDESHKLDYSSFVFGWIYHIYNAWFQGSSGLPFHVEGMSKVVGQGTIHREQNHFGMILQEVHAWEKYHEIHSCVHPEGIYPWPFLCRTWIGSFTMSRTYSTV